MPSTQRRAYPLFNLGDRVRVRAGVSHPARPDVPIGGWSGLIAEVSDEQPVTYRGSLNGETDCEIVLREESLEPENLEPLHFS